MSERRYQGTVQAEVAALTKKRIIEAAIEMVSEQWIEQITLNEVAFRAGVTVQTVLRHFGSKEGLLAAAGRIANDRAIEKRAEAPVGDVAAAVDNLLEHYEEVGERVIRLIAQEGLHPVLHELLEEGRVKHREWVERVFGPYLERRPQEERRRLLAQLVALCDVQTWGLLRKGSELSRDETELALLEMLRCMLAKEGEGR